MTHQALSDAVDKVARECGKALMPIKDLSSDDEEVVGTGFLACLDGRDYVVTAAHTVLQTGLTNAGLILSNRRYSLEHRPFYCSLDDDIGFFALDEELAEEVSGVRRLPIKRDPGVLGHSAQGVVIMGYPIHLLPGEKAPVLPLWTDLETRDVPIQSEIRDPRIYRFDAEEWVSIDGATRWSDVNAAGISGGPALAWFNVGTMEKPKMLVLFQSVVVEWGVEDGYLLGSASTRLVVLIDAYLAGDLAPF